jgi:hypothetical protein
MKISYEQNSSIFILHESMFYSIIHKIDSKNKNKKVRNIQIEILVKNISNEKNILFNINKKQ